MIKMTEWEVWSACVHPPIQKYASIEYVNNPDNWGPPLPKYKVMLGRLSIDDIIWLYLKVDESSPSGVSWRRTLTGTVGPASCVKEGSPALSTILSNGTGYGYYGGRVGRKSFSAHRVVFFLNTGKWPEVVDHIDGNSFNNHPYNLRAATQVTNQQNRRKGPVKGFYWNKLAKKFYVRVAGEVVAVAEDMLTARREYLNAYFTKYGYKADSLSSQPI